jgi:hypothetical protein
MIGLIRWEDVDWVQLAPVAASYDYNNEPLGSVRAGGYFFDLLSNY